MTGQEVVDVRHWAAVLRGLSYTLGETGAKFKALKKISTCSFVDLDR